jgi:hypothetical protein
MSAISRVASMTRGRITDGWSSDMGVIRSGPMYSLPGARMKERSDPGLSCRFLVPLG